MLIFLYGEDKFRSHEKLKEIIAKYKEKHPVSLNLKRFSFKDDDIKDFENMIDTSSLFEQKKLIILDNIFSLRKDDQKKLTQVFKRAQLKKDSDNIVVILEQGSPDKRLGLFKYLKKAAKSQQFEPLNKAQTRKWLRDFKEKHYPDLKISYGMLDWVSDKITPDLWRLQNELQKIYFYQKGSNKKQLTKEDIEKLIVFPTKTNIFNTLDAMAAKNKKRALHELANHFYTLEPELKILAMFQYQFRNLLRIKDLMKRGDNYRTIQKKTKLHPYAFKKMYGLASNFTLEELKMIHKRLFDFDIGFKTGGIQDKKMALEMFVVKLS